MGNWSIARKLALVFALGPMALVAIGALAYRSTAALLDARQWVVHTYQVRLSIAQMDGDVHNVVAQERGYIIGGEDVYARGYREGVESFNSALATFAKLTSDNPHEQTRVDTLRKSFSDLQQWLSNTMQMRSQHGFNVTLPIIRSGRAVDLTDTIHATLQDADAEETHLQDIRDAVAESAANTTLAIILFGTLGVTAVLVIVGIVAIRSLSRPIELAITALSAATAEIVAGTTQQAAGVQEQAAAVTETVATVEEIAQTAEQSNERAKAVAESSRRAADGGALGRKSVESTILVMSDVKTRSESIAQSILSLAEQAQQIGEIIAVVNDLAEQTNILALNASIEATRAGEQGKGFSVVASEIKALAEQSKKATVQVRQILGEIQKSTNGAVMATEQGTKSVDEAMRIVNEADESIRMLVDTIVEAARASTAISTSASQQVIGMSQIQQAMRNINQATTQNLASTQQAEQAARNLEGIGSRLRALLRGSHVNGVVT
jgi:methyl-accepting chemotaxis protein